MAAARPWNLRKLILRAIVFLLLGAIVNVAVAWACCVAAQSQWRSNAMLVRSSDVQFEELLERDRPDGFVLSPARLELTNWATKVVVVAERMDEMGGLSMPLQRGRLVWAGFPVISLRGTLWSEHDMSVENEVPRWNPPLRWYRGAIASDDPVHPVVVPVQPLWPGFAINTLLYTGILWLLWFTPVVIRRRVRIKRGRCPACGYRIDPGTGSVCSECGAAVSRRAEGAM